MECNIYSCVKKPGVKEAEIRRAAVYLFRFLRQDGIISVHLIGDRRMRNLNKTYRHKDRTTDVLSFCLQEGERPAPGKDWGDIFISIPEVLRQAKRFKVKFSEEFFRDLIHGVLHLLGYNHEVEAESVRMFTLQEKLLKKIL